ncbi:MAG: hypothetical protein AAF514_17385 [Verrucomicrobiota bacterium]
MIASLPPLRLSTRSAGLGSWSGYGEIWTKDSYHLCLRRSVRLSIENEGIEVCVAQRQVRFSTRDIVAARIFRFPVPSMTLIFWQGDGHGLISLFCFPRRIQNEFLEEAGFEITDRRLWRTGLEARRDQENYFLQGHSSG